jgi:Ser/Thr protein kinase RdoA (MazF antagonist)
MLARLHRDLATCGFDRPAPHFTAILDLTTTTWGTGTHTIDELIEGMAVDAPEYAASCLRLLAEVRRAVADVDLHGMQRTLVHGDWHAGNLLFRHSEVSGVLDFDFAHPDLRVADLAASAMVVDTDSAVELIEGYQEVSALPSEELWLLNLHEQARLLGAVAATLSIRARNGRAGNSLPVLAEMLHRLVNRWPELRRRIGLS